MDRLFLSSSFKDVASLFGALCHQCEGKHVIFIPTAGDVEPYVGYIEEGRKALESFGLCVDVLDLAHETLDVIASMLKGAEFIYISGGNTFYLLETLLRTGADRLIVDAVHAGAVYIGESAGTMVASPEIEYALAMDDASKAPGLDSFTALNLVPFSPLPHMGYAPFLEACRTIQEQCAEGRTLIPMTNTEAIWVEGDTYSIVGRNNTEA